MPSNEQLIQDIKQLDERADVEGLNNEQLAALKKQLKEGKGEAEAAPALPTLPTLPTLKAGQKRLAPRKSVTTRRGIVSHPYGISASDLSGGEKSFQSLQKRGIVER